ncbi:SR140 [Mytilus coruscus]|uniref:SR140 n=1 Tax=Mytilus coruscus TaxID=42192 RepID=A0A6J8ECP3_MYTCO|nr:SR140 [Mytilus coruscus]
MDASNATICSEDIEIQKNQAEKIVETNSFRKRRNSTSPSPSDEPVTKKIKTDCDNPENEEENDEENIPQPVKRREEAVKFPKLYRLLHGNEDITKGLSAKSPDAGKDVATHVATGSKRGYSSQYISTCSSLYKAESFRSLKLNSGYRWGMKDIAEIDFGSLPDNVEIFDLRLRALRYIYEIGDREIDEKFHKFAESHQEVLLVGTVPASCLKLIEFTGVVPESDTSFSDSDELLSDNLEFNGLDFNSSNSDSDW